MYLIALLFICLLLNVLYCFLLFLFVILRFFHQLVYQLRYFCLSGIRTKVSGNVSRRGTVAKPDEHMDFGRIGRESDFVDIISALRK